MRRTEFIWDSWPKILTLAACVLILGIDVSQVTPPLSVWLIRPMYLVAAVAVVAWRATGYRWALVTFGSLLCIGSLSRAVALGWQHQWRETAIKVIVAIFAYGFVRNRPGVDDGHR